MPIKQQRIAVIGAGAWGTALALLLARNGNSVRLWGNDPEQMEKMINNRENVQYMPGFSFPDSLVPVKTLVEALEGVKDILIVVPSHAFRSVIEEVARLVSSPRIAWGTKGLDPESCDVLHHVVFEVFSEDTPIAILSGPSFAKEVASEKPTAISLSGNNQAFIRDMIDRLHNRHFRVYQNEDLIGLELCGTMKNILAIAVGIADGLDLGANTRAALITRGLVEMGRLCEALGGDRQTLLSLAGIGDLVLTCTDDQSRNRRFGKAIGQGMDVKTAEESIGQAVEGLHNVRQVEKLSKKHRIEMPITHQVYRILFESVTPQAVVAELLSRVPKAE